MNNIKDEERQQNAVKVETKRRPPNAGKGRKKGVKNRFTELKTVVLDTFDELGGSQGLYEWCIADKRNLSKFYTEIFAKTIPKNIDLKADVTHDIASRLLEARKRQELIESQIKDRLEFNDTGRLITEKIIAGSVIEELEEEEKNS